LKLKHIISSLSIYMGGKKHKKKVYSTQKVTPHSHKNIPLVSLT
jgi:hypothetical protein